MRIVFMGTPVYAATILANIAAQHDVVAVFTRPDAVRGRGRKLVSSPVKQEAERLGAPVHTPRSLRAPETVELLRALNPDCICVAAYGAILPPDVLAIPPFGCLNVHASLLPAWRGAAPIERAILAGDEQTGVTIMRMEEGLDTGDWCIARSTAIGDKDATELAAELAELGSQALLSALSQVERGVADWTPQDPFFATYAEKIAKHEFFLAPEDRASAAAKKVQASSPAHPARCMVGGRTVTVVDLQREPNRLVREALALPEGQVAFEDSVLYLGFSDGPARLLLVKPDGKQTMPGRDFARGLHGLRPGSRLLWEGLDV